MSDKSDQAGLTLISRFLRFPYEKFSDELHSSYESCDTSASSAALCPKLNHIHILFYLGNLDERSSSSAGPAAFFVFHCI